MRTGPGPVRALKQTAGRYKALSVDESDAFYLRTVCDYVHLNPVRAGWFPGRQRWNPTSGAAIRPIWDWRGIGRRG